MKTSLILVSLIIGMASAQTWAMDQNSAKPENKDKASQFELLRSLPPAIFKATMDDLGEQDQTCAGVTCKDFHDKDDRYRAHAKRNEIVVPADKQYRSLRAFISYLNKYQRVDQLPPPSILRGVPHDSGDSKTTESKLDSKTKDARLPTPQTNLNGPRRSILSPIPCLNRCRKVYQLAGSIRLLSSASDSESAGNESGDKKNNIASLITKIDLGSLHPESSSDASTRDVLKRIQVLFPNLEELHLANDNLQKGDLEIIGQMKNLRVLDLSGTSFYHPGIQHLKNLAEMRRLNLSAPGVAPSNFNPAAQFLHLSKMHHLMYLDFTQTPQTARAFQNWILSITDDKNGFAAYRRALMHEYGTDDHKGPPVDTKLAIASYGKAAELGHPLAQTQLANFYQKGIGVKVDHAKAYHWFKQAYRQGHAEARRGYWETRFSRFTPEELALKHATLLSHKEPAHNSPKEAFNYQSDLGWMYLEGLGVTQNDGQALFWLRKAAEKGLADAQTRLGFIFDLGRGVSQASQAAAWYRKAAENGLAQAQNNLGLNYESGREGTQSYVLAMKWYRKAAEQGLSFSQHMLGMLYYRGLGVGQDSVRAVEWFRKAAEQGFSFSQNELGTLYYRGLGVGQDSVRAVEWFRKAAEQDLANAQNWMGFLYSEGQGVQQDYSQAVNWYHKGAAQGLADAQYILGISYEQGLGVDPNREEAIRWYRLAAAQRYGMAQARLRELLDGSDSD